ncbi:MAG: TonB-dependent receptor [Pseudomonadales bacterium]|jgi:vitamin B12 transporter|nr:TonB-dependent receptor [Pseudomonadales bacterium]MDP6471178.1 TonB-dependent receptor [Pseudomonadales bacterium]MDP6825635.1 TonB-dependent receptor [Pseudomonadales bacterium]MDP6970450.1 TonB-dependent receptor [Pseudomonadales bacterium]
MNSIKGRLLTFCFASAASICLAEPRADSETADETLVVYSVRLEQPMAEVGSSVTVITSEDMDAMGVDFALDAIATAPGVTVNQSGSFGGLASVRIRGASSAQTLVVVDGAVVNDPTSPGGGFDFARFDTQSIERIEILKGPQSTLWGSDAIGGVVNIITRRPAEALKGNLFLEGGSFGSMRGGAAITGAYDGYDFRLGVSHHDSDGISRADEENGNKEEDGFESTIVSASGSVRLPGKAHLQARVVWTEAESEFDSFVFGAQGNVGDGNELTEMEELTGTVTLRVPLLDGKLDNLLLAGYSDIERTNYTDGRFGFSSEGDRVVYRYRGTLAVSHGHRLAFGLEREEIETRGGETSLDGRFALYEWQPLESLTLTAGLRRDDHEHYDRETTGRFAAAYNPHERVMLHASWGEGFKAPTVFQTTFFCCGAAAPNPNLKPETSKAWDAGITVRTVDARGELDLTYFDQDTVDMIDFSFTLGGYENIAEVRSEGVELHGRYGLTDWLDASLSYTYVDAEDGHGDRLIRMPRHSGNLRLSLNPDGRLSGALLVRYNDEERDPNGTVDAWTRMDLSARYALTSSVELFARIENLLDEEYQQVLGYGTPGLSGYFGARLNF